jgi:NTE family protein
VSDPRARPRRGLVLGSGGVLGFAWLLGALSALEEEAGFDARDVEVVVGTSAGSVAAALLGCRLPVAAITRHHQGLSEVGDPVLSYDYASGVGRSLPPRPGWRPAAPRLAWQGLRHPGRISPVMAATGLLPSGRGSLDPVRALVAAAARAAGYDDRWPDGPRPWIVAADQISGRRVVFGRDNVAAGADGRPRIVRRARLPEAVQASCSIPGWYPPTVIDGVPYIDGGAVSIASVDVLRHTTLDEVYVLAPMASIEPDRPAGGVARLERRVRRLITRRVVADAATLRAAGIRVYLITPGAADLAAMGLNLMNPARRTQVLDTARATARAQLREQLQSGTADRRPRAADSRGGTG